MWDPIENKFTHTARLHGSSWHFGILVFCLYSCIFGVLQNLCDDLCAIDYHDYCKFLPNLNERMNE